MRIFAIEAWVIYLNIYTLKTLYILSYSRIRVLDCYVYPVLMYGSAAWSITSGIKRRLQSCEMWFFRKMMKIPWSNKVCNEDVFSRAQVKRKLMNDIRVRQLNFLGPIIRKDRFENLAMTGRIEGKRNRGRGRVTWMFSVKGWLQERGVKHQEVELIERARNRKLDRLRPRIWHLEIYKHTYIHQ